MHSMLKLRYEAEEPLLNKEPTYGKLLVGG